ncbi:MAG: hypothetical protein ACR2H4_13615 [Pyrinomonadaceae bacterium]
MTRKPLILISCLLLQFGVAIGQTRPSECKTDRNAPPAGRYAWPHDARVQVYFVRGMFTKEQQQALLKAMAGWSESAKRNGAGVTFVYVGETDGARTCTNCLTVTRREVYKNDRKHYAFFVPLGMKAQGLLKSAWIDLDVATTEPQALQGFMAHELAHGMGLWDCPKCKKKQSIMSSFPGINKNNGLLEPSVCDLEVMREVFEKQRHGINIDAQTAAIRVESDTP